jgi:hypothetical protein
MDGTTDYSALYLIFSLSIILLIISVWTISTKGSNLISIGCMFIASIAFFSIANMFVNGSLVTTQSFINSTGGIVISEQPIRNLSTSHLFQFVGGFFVVLTFLQILFVKKHKVFSNESYGDGFDEIE